MNKLRAPRGSAFVVIVAMVLAALGCGGAGSAPRAVTLRVALKSAHYRLENGLEVVLHEDRALRSAIVDVRYHVGGKDDPPERSGFAHLYEHLMFLGSQKISEAGFTKALDDVGALSYNASTTADVTEYYETVPPAALPIALWLEADRMASPLERLTDPSFKRERDVVKNEWRQRYDNEPYGHVWSFVRGAVFPVGHPYHLPPIGLPEQLDLATVEEAKLFGKRFYTPCNATLVVAGDIDIDETKKLVDELFAPIPSGQPIPSGFLPFPRLESDRRLVVEADVDSARVVVAWPIPPPYSRGSDEAVFAGSRITGMTSWKLRTNSKVARDVHWNVTPGRLASLLGVTIDLQPGESVDAALAALETRVGWVSRPDETDSYWSDFVDLRTNRMTRTVLPLSNIVARAERLQDYTEYLGAPDSAQDDLRRIQAVRAVDAATAAQTFLAESGKVVVVVQPTRGAPRSGRIVR